MEVENGRIKHYKGHYYIYNVFGERYVVKKSWVKENIHLISNASCSNNSVYLVKDEYERAIEIIIRDIESQIKSNNGFNIQEELNMVKIDSLKLNNIPSRATVREAWGYIRSLSLDNCLIYTSCIQHVIKKMEAQGYQIWQLTTSSENKILFSDKTKATNQQIKLSGRIGHIQETK